MNQFQGYQLVVFWINTTDEEQTRISLVDNLILLPFNEIAQSRGSGKNEIG
eukprot:EC715152.1.p3 GENE.EC715152.1~~EC715152.1.p3  ORF type:complete len:51 (-),score=2.77 EC715152.1:192-344(-)